MDDGEEERSEGGRGGKRLPQRKLLESLSPSSFLFQPHFIHVGYFEEQSRKLRNVTQSLSSCHQSFAKL